MIPRTENETAKYVDIPLANVKDASIILERHRSQSRSPPTNTISVLHISLKEDSHSVYYINELERPPCDVKLAFDAFEDAKMVAIHMGFERNATRQALEPEQHIPVSKPPDDSAKLRISQPELMDVAEQLLDEDGHTVIEDGGFMTAQADGGSIEQKSAIPIPNNLDGVQQDDFKKRADDAAKDKATANVAKKRTQLFSVAQSPIDVSLVDDIEADAEASSQNDLDAIDLNRPSVEQWRKGTQAIGDAFKLKQPTPSGQDEANSGQTAGGNVDWSLRSDNDLYDASPAPKPRSYQAHTEESIKPATQVRKERGEVPRGKLSRSMRTMNGATQSDLMFNALSTSFNSYNQKAQSKPTKRIQNRRDKPKAFKDLASRLDDKNSSDHGFWETGNRPLPDMHSYTPRVTERPVDEFDIPSSSPSPRLSRLKAKRVIQSAQDKRPNKAKQPGKKTLQPKTTNERITKSAAKHKNNLKMSDYVTKDKKWKENWASEGSRKLLSQNLGNAAIEEKPAVRLNAAGFTKDRAAPTESQKALLNVRKPVKVESKPLRSTRAAAQVANRKIQKINHTESLAEEQLYHSQFPNAILPASNGQNVESLQATPNTAHRSPSDIARKPAQIQDISRDANAFTDQTFDEYKTIDTYFKKPADQTMDDTPSGIQVPRSSPLLPPEGTSRPDASTKKEASQSNLNKATYSISHVSESNQTPYLVTNHPEDNLAVPQDDEGMYFQDAMASYDASAFARPSPSIGSIASQKLGLATKRTPAKNEMAQEINTEIQKFGAPMAQMQDSKKCHDDSREPKRTLTDLSPGPNGMEKLLLTEKIAGEQLKQTKTPLSTIAKDALTVLQPDQDQSTWIPEDVLAPHKPLKWLEETQSFASCMKNALSKVSNTEKLVGQNNHPANPRSEPKTGQPPRHNTKVKFAPVDENRPLKNVTRKIEIPDTNNNGQRVAPQETKMNASQDEAIRLYKTALQLSDSDPGPDDHQSVTPDSNLYNISRGPDVEKEYAVRRTPKQVQQQEIESPTSSTYYKVATLLKDAVSKPKSRPGAKSGRSQELKSEATHKRQLENMEMPTQKRSRQSSLETEMPKGEEKPKLEGLTGKSQVISFGNDDPRIQGTPSPAKAERMKNSLEQDHSENRSFQRPSAKRKREQRTTEHKEGNEIMMHSTGAETQHRRKRERTDTDEIRLPLRNITPFNEKRTQQRKPRSKESPNIFRQTKFPEVAEEPFHRFSSQSLRVAENGSPLPFKHTRNTRDLETTTMLGNAHLGESENIKPTADDDDLTLVPPAHVATRKLESRRSVNRRIERPFALARTSPVSFIRSTGGKRRPASPNASSSIVEDLHYHHVQLGGRLINMKTAEPVVLAEPPDPFSERTIHRPSSFISMLRAASISHKPNAVIPEFRPDRLRDPERTLIEAPLSCDNRQNNAIEISSGSEHSDSRDISQPVKADVDLMSEGTNAWREALQPHHGDTLGILYEISHVRYPEFHSAVASQRAD